MDGRIEQKSQNLWPGFNLHLNMVDRWTLTIDDYCKWLGCSGPNRPLPVPASEADNLSVDIIGYAYQPDQPRRLLPFRWTNLPCYLCKTPVPVNADKKVLDKRRDIALIARD
jgi:hypothetical protein